MMNPFAVLVIGAALTLPLFLLTWAFAFAAGRRELAFRVRQRPAH